MKQDWLKAPDGGRNGHDMFVHHGVFKHTNAMDSPITQEILPKWVFNTRQPREKKGKGPTTWVFVLFLAQNPAMLILGESQDT